MSNQNGKSPALQWYPKDIVTDKKVIAMTLEQECCYRRLLDFCWIENGLDNNPALLASYCKMTGQIAAFQEVWKVVKKCFTLRRGKWLNKRQELERKKQKLYSEKQRNNANHRWDKGKEVHATALPRHESGNALHLQSSSASSSSNKDQSKTDLFNEQESRTLKEKITEVMGYSLFSEANAEALTFVTERVKKYQRRHKVANPFAYALTTVRNLKTEYKPQGV